MPRPSGRPSEGQQEGEAPVAFHSVDGCPGTHRFVTADTPRVYGTTRLLGWTDLNETADVTWTGHKPKRKTIVSSAERGTQGGGRSEQTLAAF